LPFNFTFGYKDDVLSLNNYVDRIHPIEPEIKEERLRTKLYGKRDDFNFHIVNFPFIRSTIPAAQAI
jgi:hypothetical protein